MKTNAAMAAQPDAGSDALPGDGLPTGNSREANTQLLAGLGLGVYAAGSIALFGAVCPVCVVASPLLLGAGLIGRRRNAKSSRTPDSEP